MISIIIPAHNEEKRITETLENYGKFFREKKAEKEIRDFEILVVINNTQDRTEEIVKSFIKKYSEIRYLKFKEGGKGFAIIEGFREALKRGNRLIGFVDGDMSTPPEAFYDLIMVLKKNKKIDGVIADRWNRKSIIQPKQTFLRRFVSRGYNLIVRALFLFPYQDTQCGAKMFRREFIEKTIHKLKTIGWGFDIALLFCLKKETDAKIISIPTIWKDKQESHINLKKIPLLMFLSAIRLRMMHSPFNFLVRFYRKLPKKLKLNEILK